MYYRLFIFVTVFFLSVSNVWARQTPFAQGQLTSPVLASLSKGSSYRNEWMKAAGNANAQRQISERIGEDGAKLFAEQMGWSKILSPSNKGTRHGIDQTYRNQPWLDFPCCDGSFRTASVIVLVYLHRAIKLDGLETADYFRRRCRNSLGNYVGDALL